jgi:hypothetical protein
MSVHKRIILRDFRLAAENDQMDETPMAISGDEENTYEVFEESEKAS